METIFSEDEMAYYHLAFSARRIDDHSSVVSNLKALYELVRKNENDNAKAAKQQNPDR